MKALCSVVVVVLGLIPLACGGGGGKGPEYWQAPDFSMTTVTSVADTDGASYPLLAALSDGFALAYNIGPVGHLAKLDSSGTIQWDQEVIDDDNCTIRDLAASDSELAVVWTCLSPSTGLYFASYDMAGQSSASSTVTDQTNLGTQNPDNASIVFNGSGYAVAWNSQDLEDAPNPNSTYIFFALLDSSGQIVGDASIFDTTQESADQPSLVWTGSGYAMAWTAGQTDPSTYFALAGSDGSINSGPTGIATTGSFSISPSLAKATDGFGVAYMDNQGNDIDSYDIYLMRVGADGSPQGSAVKMSTAADAGDPSLVCSGTRFGMVWSYYSNTGQPALYFGEADDAGKKLGDAKVFDITNAAPFPRMVWTGTGYAFAWFGEPSWDDTIKQILLAQ